MSLKLTWSILISDEFASIPSLSFKNLALLPVLFGILSL